MKPLKGMQNSTDRDPNQPKALSVSDIDHFAPLSPADKVGKILVDAGVLTAKDVGRILNLQKKKNIRFGDAAIKLRLLDKKSLQNAIAVQQGYPCLLPGQGGLGQELVVAFKPFSSEAEAFRTLRSHLLLREAAVNNKPLAVVSPDAKEGRTYVAANLAVVFSQMGKRTLLIDADLRRPRQHTIFKLRSNYGLSTVLAGHTERFFCMQPAVFSDLYVIPAGPNPPNPQELLSQPQLALLLKKATEHFEIIIVDTPPATLFADAEIIASQAGRAILVSCRHRSRASATRNLTSRLSRTTRLLGSVLNDYS